MDRDAVVIPFAGQAEKIHACQRSVVSKTVQGKGTLVGPDFHPATVPATFQEISENQPAPLAWGQSARERIRVAQLFRKAKAARMRTG